MSNVIALPTKTNIETQWSRYTALCRRLAEQPALMHDGAFVEALDVAESEWLGSYKRWARCA